MTVDQPFNVYQEQLSSNHHGMALWNPNPVQHLDDDGHISIGDVGYLCDGDFIRMFNVTLAWNDPSNTRLGIPMEYQSLQHDVFDVRVSELSQTEYLSLHVSKVENTGNVDIGQTYKCRARCRGALLLLPHGGRREDVIRTRVFEEYYRDNVVSWFDWSREIGLPVERMEDLVLVTGCTLATSWARASFDNLTTPVDASITLHAQRFVHGGAHFIWSNARGNVVYHNSHQGPNVEQPLPHNQCVFFQGFRARPRLFFKRRRWGTRAEPFPNCPDDDSDDDNDKDNGIHRRQIDGERSMTTWFRFRDTLFAIFNYIVEKSFKCDKDAIAEDLRAIARQLIEDVEILTTDALERFLHEKQMPLLIKNLNGGAILRDPRDNEPLVSDEKKATFYAADELNGEPVPLVIHPAFTKYPQIINVEAFSDLRGADITVQDVLRTIHEILRTPSSKRELNKLAGCRQSARIYCTIPTRLPLACQV